MANSRSISEVFNDMVHNVQDIVRGEIDLAKTQLRADFTCARPALVMVVVGAVAGFLSAFFLLLFVVQTLSLVIPSWAATLAVGIVMAIAASVLVEVGVRRMRRSIALVPKAISDTPKEEVTWLRHRSR